MKAMSRSHTRATYGYVKAERWQLPSASPSKPCADSGNCILGPGSWDKNVHWVRIWNSRLWNFWRAKCQVTQSYVCKWIMSSLCRNLEESTFFFFFLPHGLQDLSSPARDWARATAVKRLSPTTGPPRNARNLLSWKWWQPSSMTLVRNRCVATALLNSYQVLKITKQWNRALTCKDTTCYVVSF